MVIFIFKLEETLNLQDRLLMYMIYCNINLIIILSALHNLL
jgi:hypothetical protein